MTGAKCVINDFVDVNHFLELLQIAAVPTMAMHTIFHITRIAQWEAAKNLGYYRGDTLDTEGFIHCSKATQVVKVANRFFCNQRDLVLLCIDSHKVRAEIRYEAAEVDEVFPHIYGELNVDAVYDVVDFEAGEEGFFELPIEVVG